MNNLILKFVTWYISQWFCVDMYSREREQILRAIARGHMDRYTEDNLPTTIDCLQESISNAAKMEYNQSVKRLEIEKQITQLKKQLKEL